MERKRRSKSRGKIKDMCLLQSGQGDGENKDQNKKEMKEKRKKTYRFSLKNDLIVESKTLGVISC